MVPGLSYLLNGAFQTSAWFQRSAVSLNGYTGKSHGLSYPQVIQSHLAASTHFHLVLLTEEAKERKKGHRESQK